MGMFNNLYSDYPLPFDFGAEDPKTIDFQTKDFDCLMDNYKITSDGKLIKEYSEWENVPPEERKYPPGDINHFIGSLRKINIYWGEIQYHGVINFYTYREKGENFSEWIEFDAIFSHGKLEEIELKNHYLDDTTEQNNRLKELFAKEEYRRSKWYLRVYDKINSKLWRIKNRLKNKIVNCIYKL